MGNSQQKKINEDELKPYLKEGLTMEDLMHISERNICDFMLTFCGSSTTAHYSPLHNIHKICDFLCYFLWQILQNYLKFVLEI